MTSATDYKLYAIKDRRPVECENIDPEKGRKRVIMIGGIQDLCGRSVEEGTWIALYRALKHGIPATTDWYTVGKANKPAWLEDSWTLKSFIGGEKNPPAETLAEKLFHLPVKNLHLTDKAGYLKQLNKLADSTVFVTFSTGSLLLQHVRDYMVERLHGNGFSDSELSPVMAKIGALNIAPIYHIKDKPVDFTQVAVLNMRDPYGAGTLDIARYKDEIIERGNTLSVDAGSDDKQHYFQAYEEKLLKLLQSQKGNYNPNLLGADHEVLGSIAINSRNLVIYGKAEPDRYPSRIVHQVNKGEHTTPAPNEQDNPLIKEHEPALYLNVYASTLPKGAEQYKIIQTFQRFAGAHIIPVAVKALMQHKPLKELAELVAQEEQRSFARDVLERQERISSSDLPKRS